MPCFTACMILTLLAPDTTRIPAAAPAPPPAPPAAEAPALAGPRRERTAWPLAAPGAPLPPALAAPLAAADTMRGPPPIEYSDAYFTRLTIHKWGSYLMLPLFAAQYAAGEKLLDQGDAAPGWARDAHGPLAAGVATLFTVNTVTGVWNLWEGRRDPEGRGRRMLHSLLMIAADAGFVATGMLAEDAEESAGKRDLHRNIALGSMATAVLGWSIMLPVFGGGK
jgi:hypothetical protein